MKIDILSVFTNEVIFSHDEPGNTLVKTIEKAVKLGVNLSNANLSSANLSGANLSGANLSNASLSGANLSRANLSKANLSGGSFYVADLSRTNFIMSNLYKASLSGANLSGVKLSEANLSGAYYYNASISNNVLQIMGLCWDVIIFDYHIKIGCKLYLSVEWESFTEEEIAEMNKYALAFWKAYKEPIMALAKSHQLFWREIK